MMSDQEAINILRYFEFATLRDRDEARKIAIQALQERIDKKKAGKEDK